MEGTTWIKVESGSCLGNCKLFDTSWEHSVREWWERNLERWAEDKSCRSLFYMFRPKGAAENDKKSFNQIYLFAGDCGSIY